MFSVTDESLEMLMASSKPCQQFWTVVNTLIDPC
ncbi:hypothetical protein MCEWOLH11_00818 [Candidatus Methylopumilus universalis]